MNRNQKSDVVSIIRQHLKSSSIVIVASQVGLNVDEVTNLRKRVRSSNATFKVVKNTLLNMAVKDSEIEGLSKFFKGPTALCYSNDPVSASKVIVDFAKENSKIKILGGSMDSKIITDSDIKALATLPSMDELRSKIIGLVLAPATKIAVLVKEPSARIARVLAARQ